MIRRLSVWTAVGAAASLVVVACGSSTGPATAPTRAPTTVARTLATSAALTTVPTSAVATVPATRLAVDGRIAAVGDIACDPGSSDFNGGAGTADRCRHQAVADLAVAGNYTAFLPLGDIQYESGAYAAFQASYDVAFGAVRSITHPVPGNHEYITSKAADYFRYFGAAAADPSTGYYSYDIGSWHVVALNSNCDFVSCKAGSPQEQWLRADLAAHPSACTLVYWHHPRFSSGEHGDNPGVGALFQAAYDAGVELVLSGHDHDYERFAPRNPSGQIDTARGVRQFVVGTGGKNHYTAVPGAATEVANDTTYGMLELTLHPGSYDWHFLPVAGSTFTDSGSQTCH